ncbi:MAG: helix-turn-helix transcriptional regulator [Planctomycetales bacterium]|nr:MAG: helix-turn-helix transcriptional regulator [Planctomycetales bacterium]
MQQSKTLGQNVRRRRQKLGISQEELALRSGLNRTYVTDVELGKYNVTLLTICKLAGALECRPSELLRGVSPVDSK